MQMKEMGRQSREGERITWSEGACLLSSAMVCCGGDGGWRCCFSSSSLCRGVNPCVFSFSFSFCFPSLGSRLSIFVLLLSFFSLFLCFSIFLFLLCCSLFCCPLFSSLLSLYSFVFLSFCSSSAAPFSSALSSPVHEERGLLPLSSHGTGVGWSGRPLCSRPRTARGARPLYFSPRGRPRVRA